MGFTVYTIGITTGLIAVVPLVVGARQLQRTLLTGASRATASLAVIAVVLVTIVVVSEALGTVSAFRRFALCAALAVVGAAGWTVGRRLGPTPLARRQAAAPVLGRAGNVVAALAVAVVVASWVARTAASYRHGMETIDTLWYHMPNAARYAQSSSTTHILFVDARTATAFFPATSPLLHALGIEWFRSDLLSPVANLAWLALALLAAWSIGERYGVAPASTVAVAVVLSNPGLVATQPGGAYTDVVGIALLLTAVALTLEAEAVRTAARSSHRFALVLAGFAAGLSAGTKFTLLAPIGLLAIAVVVDAWARGAGRRRFPSDAALLVGALIVAGGYYYVRNWIAVGNPLPSLSFGPLGLPTQPGTPQSYTAAHYLLRASVWRTYYFPGLRQSLGLAWWAVLALTIGGGVLAIVSGRLVLERMLGVVVLGSIVAFLFTPQYLGTGDQPLFFVFNVRYLSPALVLGLCLLPTAPALVRANRARSVLGVLAAGLVATQYGETIWSWGGANRLFVERVATVDIIVGVAFAAVVAAIGVAFALARVPRGAVASAALVGLASVLVVGGYPLQETYLRHRYTSSPPMPNVYRWARDQKHQRIAVWGTELQYPLYGTALTNYVQYLGRTSSAGWFTVPTTCREWRRALAAGGYDYVLIAPNVFLQDRTPARGSLDEHRSARAARRARRHAGSPRGRAVSACRAARPGRLPTMTTARTLAPRRGQVR